jgi:hypothetical protein
VGIVSPLDSNELQLYVETDGVTLAIEAEVAPTSGVSTLSFKSDVDSHDCPGQSIGSDRFSLRLV